MPTNRIFQTTMSKSSTSSALPPATGGGFAFCFVPGAHPFALAIQVAAQQQATEQLAERAKRVEWQQIMARCGIDYQI